MVGLPVSPHTRDVCAKVAEGLIAAVALVVCVVTAATLIYAWFIA